MSQDPLQTYLENLEDSSFANYSNSLIQDIAERGKTDLYFLNKYILGYKEMVERVHRPMCSFYQRPEKKKLHLHPRGTFKTSTLTVGGTIQNILNDADIRILLDNEVVGNTTAWLREIKGHFERNELFRLIYGDWVGTDLWTDRKIIVSRRTQERASPTIMCIGVETGTGGTSQHYDRIHGDDLVSAENTTNSEQMEKVKEHVRTLLPILDPGGFLDLVGTRWHQNELYGDIVKDVETGDSKFIIFITQAIQSDGTLLFPERLSKEFLDEQRSGMGSFRFSAQYQNEPVDSEMAAFKRKSAELMYWDLTEKSTNDIINNPQRPLRVLVTCDPAISEKEQADFTVVSTFLVDHENKLYLYEYVRGQWGDPKFIINELYNAYENAKHLTQLPIRIGVEAIAFQRLLVYGLRDEQKLRKDQDKFIVHELKADSSKERRILSLQPRYENNAFMWRKKHAELENELFMFPKGKNDDIADTCAMALQLLQETEAPPIVKAEDTPGTIAHYIKNQRHETDSRYYGKTIHRTR